MALWVAIVAGVVFTLNLLLFDVAAVSMYMRLQEAASQLSQLTEPWTTLPQGDSALPPGYCDPQTRMQLDGTPC